MRAKTRGLRLLTFLCFFNFSGLNNGYTYLAEVSPLSPSRSVSSVGFFLNAFRDSCALRNLDLFWRQGAGASAKIARALNRSFQAAGFAASRRVLGLSRPGMKTLLTSSRKACGLLSQAYAKSKEEFWNKENILGVRNSEPGSSPFALLLLQPFLLLFFSAARVGDNVPAGERRIRRVLHFSSGDDPAPLEIIPPVHENHSEVDHGVISFKARWAPTVPAALRRGSVAP